MTLSLDAHPTTAEILGRLINRSDLPADVIATLHLCRELAVLREHDAHRTGFAEAAAQAGRGMPR